MQFRHPPKGSLVIQKTWHKFERTATMDFLKGKGCNFLPIFPKKIHENFRIWIHRGDSNAPTSPNPPMMYPFGGIA